MQDTIGSRLAAYYRRAIGEPASPAEVYGYWVVVLGLLVGMVGIVTFLWGSLFEWGTDGFWLFREAGVVLAAVGLPVLLVGITVRLPLQPAATAIAGTGLLVTLVAVAWFVALYPAAWTVAEPPLIPVLGYSAGVALVGGAITLVPLVVAPVPPDQDPGAVGHPYYVMRETVEGWTWELHGSDGALLGASTGRFESSGAAREDLDHFSIRAPAAGIEVLAAREP
jgi:hypothetical protein